MGVFTMKKGLSKAEKKRLEELFSKYCQNEILTAKCDGNYSCENCSVARAYQMIFANDNGMQSNTK